MARAAVTGAFGFTGRHIAARLLERGDEVVNLTNHPNRHVQFADRVTTVPLAFDDPDGLARSLEGCRTLFNTYWIRFAHGGVSHTDAVRNSTTLFTAARRAGVERVVQVSIANPDPDSPLPYYRGKAQVEAALAASALSHAILRPAVLVGDQPILTNTIAWLLRRLPVFGIAGRGDYPIAPIHVADLTELALEAAARTDDLSWDAVGPETFTFAEYVAAIRAATHARCLLLHLPGELVLLAARTVSVPLHDTLLTRDELTGLTSGLLTSHQPPRGHRRVSDWLRDNGSWLGRSYLPEVGRHFDVRRA
jgi:uncharacterized protein YbjT (DUF2867 family)